MNRPFAEAVLESSLRERYYSAGYWRHEDLWTSFTKIVAANPRADAFIEGRHRITFTELAERSQRFGEAAQARGLAEDDVLIVHGRHCIEAAVAILGCAYAKLVVAILPPMFSVRQIRDILENSAARAIVGLGEPAEVERTLTAARSANLGTIVVADAHAGAQGATSWSDFVRPNNKALNERTPMSADALSLLTFSSGTTGAPKGVMHSTNTLRYAVERYCEYQEIGPKDTSLVVTAFGFVGSSILGIYLSFLVGCRTVLLRTWNVDETLDLIERHRVTHFLLMPTHAIDILNSPKLDRTDCSSVSRGVVAGISEAHRIDARRRLCAKPFPMYGMSESPGHVTGSMQDDWEKLRTSEGKCLPGTEILICDDEDRPVPPNTTGNILVRGPNRFLGYFRAEQMNRDSITRDGYFRTGDLGVIDGEGYLTFIGRSKDIIRRGGITIVPSDVEAALRAYPRIADVAVIALPDARLGERSCACVITRDTEPLTLAEITEFLQAQEVARYLWPEDVQCCESFPRTPSLKVQKNDLRKLIMQRLGMSP